MEPKDFAKVEVTWIDAQSSLEVYSVGDLINLEPLITKSCGYLIYEDDDKIILGFMLFGGDLIKHHQVIPKGMIQTIRRLK